MTVFFTGSALAGNESIPPSPADSLSYFSNKNKKKQKTLKPRVELNHRYSNDRAITMSEFWVPLAEGAQNDSVLFGDLRLMGDNNDNKEFNVGLGYRKAVDGSLDNQTIVGGMVWYDRRHTARGSKFNQITVSGEVISDTYDVRSNLYIPLNDSKTHTQENPNGTGTGFVGNQILVNTDQTVIEEALPGVDFEIGTRIKALDKITDATRVYAGAYHFEGERVEDVTGVRARIASDITRDIQIGARYQYDDVRDSQTYVEATVRFPFKAKKSFKQNGVISRLDESPERDIDIVHNEAIIDDGVNEIILNAATGVTQNVLHVDNTAGGGGDGTIETPFNTLAAAEAAAVSHDMIYVHRGDGTTTGQDAGITIDDTGQILAGSGANLLFSSGKFATSNNKNIRNGIVAGTETTAPIITNRAGNGVDVTADDVLITGITVDGATNRGIFSENADNTVIDTVTASNNTLDGIRIQSSLSNSISRVTVKKSIANGNSSGIKIRASSEGVIKKVDIADNVANNNNVEGFGIIIQPSGLNSIIDQANIIGNTANGNTNNGIIAASNSNAEITSVNILNNLTNMNVRNGINARTFDSGKIVNAKIFNNSARNNTSSGFLAESVGAGSVIKSLNLINNISNNNTSNGFSLTSNSGGVIEKVKAKQNSSNSNGNNGYAVSSADTGSLFDEIYFLENIASNNTTDGLNIVAQFMGGVNNGVFEKNQVFNNGDFGFDIRDASSVGITNLDAGGGNLGSVGQNSFYNNTLADIRIDFDGAELKAENNWWGTAAGLLPAETVLLDGSTIDSTPFLTSDPN
jgi:hypothetical protein